MKQLLKQQKGLVGLSLTGAAGSLALSGLGGTIAGNAQAGLANASSFAPAIGTIAGAAGLMRSVDGLSQVLKKRRR